MSAVKKITVIVFCSVLISQCGLSQKRWDGEGGDNQWANALNWDDNVIPASADSVVFDNSLVTGNYSVVLPGGASGIAVKAITIRPADTFLIRLVLPSTNTAIPGLSLTSLQLNRGAEFQNSSGGSPGVAFSIADSLYIFNGGRYIHNTANAHAAIVTKLSRRQGTEQGSFEFNVPGAASYTVSLVARVYGNLVLSSAAAGGHKSYLSTGSTAAIINGDCIIASGVNFSLDFTATITIKGSLINSGNFNIATAGNNNVVRVGRNLFCSGTISESSAGLPIVELNGTQEQHVSVTGAINNSVTLRINAVLVKLLSPVLLPFKLDMVKGRLVSTAASMLTLSPDCTLVSDSTDNGCFVNGPLQKLGLLNDDYFHFPIGKGSVKRWLSIKDFAGDLTVEYFNLDPHTLSAILGVGLSHVSKLEYWSISSGSGVTFYPELSFDNVNSGGVTNMNNLRVAMLSDNYRWLDGGNIDVTGSAGSAGSVTGNETTVAAGSITYVTLASDASNQNPLPLRPPLVSGVCRSGKLTFSWRPERPNLFHKIELEMRGGDGRFVPVKTTGATHSGSWLVEQVHTSIDVFRLKMYTLSGEQVTSNQVHPACRCGALRIIACLPEQNAILIESDLSRTMKFLIIGMDGKTAVIPNVFIPAGRHKISLSLSSLATGFYQVFALSSAARTNPFLFFKP